MIFVTSTGLMIESDTKDIIPFLRPRGYSCCPISLFAFLPVHQIQQHVLLHLLFYFFEVAVIVVFQFHYLE